MRVIPDVVIHLAAQPLVRRSYTHPLDTWSVNVIGTLNLLEALKPLNQHCSVVVVTTDKVYENREWSFSYRETDKLGGADPYSASKAAVEIAVASWRSSFCGQGSHQNPNLAIATARAGNVIGGGDWAEDRIIPDAMRCLSQKITIPLRNPKSTRPWQHVLEPLSGYLLLAEKLTADPYKYASAFNFGPSIESNMTVGSLVSKALKYWSGEWIDVSEKTKLHEAVKLHLQIDKAYHELDWIPRWNFDETVKRTVYWYRTVNEGANAHEACINDIQEYESILLTSP